MNVSASLSMGRPRKNGPRYPNGSLKPRTDHGTPEVIMKRLQLAGPGNTSLAHYPFGVALARGIVTMEEHDAGMSYARSYRIAMGGLPDRLEPTVARFQPSGGGEIPDRVENAATAHWRAGSAALMRLSRQTKDDLENLVLFDRWPLWLDPQHMPRPKDLRQQARIKAGLAVLVGLV